MIDWLMVVIFFNDLVDSATNVRSLSHHFVRKPSRKAILSAKAITIPRSFNSLTSEGNNEKPLDKLFTAQFIIFTIIFVC